MYIEFIPLISEKPAGPDVPYNANTCSTLSSCDYLRERRFVRC